MAFTRTKFIRLLKIGVSILAAIIIIAFAIFRSLPYARGPEITIYSPAEGATIASSTVDIIGQADRINSLAIDGDPLSVDEKGNFKKTLVIFPGVNMIALDATDQFGRSVRKTIEIVGQ